MSTPSASQSRFQETLLRSAEVRCTQQRAPERRAAWQCSKSDCPTRAGQQRCYAEDDALAWRALSNVLQPPAGGGLPDTISLLRENARYGATEGRARLTCSKIDEDGDKAPTSVACTLVFE